MGRVIFNQIFNNQTSNDSSANNSSAVFPEEGGFVLIHPQVTSRYDDVNQCRLLGVSDYYVSDNHTNIPVVLDSDIRSNQMLLAVVANDSEENQEYNRSVEGEIYNAYTQYPAFDLATVAI